MRFRFLYLIAPVLIAACSFSVERAQVRLNSDLRTSYSGTLKGGMFDSEEIEKVETALVKCGIQVRRFSDNELSEYLGVTLGDVTPEAVDTYLPCIPMDGSLEVSPHLEDGWFYNYYKLEFNLAVPRCVLTRTEGRVTVESAPSGSIFPHLVRLMLPGEVHDSSLRETVRTLDFSSQADNGTVTVRSSGMRHETRQSQDKRHAYCERFVSRVRDDDRQKFEEDRLAIVAHSRVAKFDLNTILAALGILAGSGIMVELLRRAFFRRENERSGSGS